MKIEKDNLLESIVKSISEIEYVKSEEIPNIDLYMDQVTSFMEHTLGGNKRYPEDKILTKTMINNYAKNDLLPPPEKKKYSKEHLLVLIFIYYFKNIMSIGDIEKLLTPLNEKYFHAESARNITSIYDEMCASGKDRLSFLEEDIRSAYEASRKSFPNGGETDREKEMLQLFSFICTLSLDVYVKKQLIEKLIDLVSENTTDTSAKEKHKNKKETK